MARVRRVSRKAVGNSVHMDPGGSAHCRPCSAERTSGRTNVVPEARWGVSWPVCFCPGGACRLIHSSFPYRRSRHNLPRAAPPPVQPPPRGAVATSSRHDGSKPSPGRDLVKEVRLVGNTAFTSQQLSEITAPVHESRAHG